MISGFEKSPKEIPPGWLPVGISNPYSLVRWMYVGNDILPDSFFELSVQRLRALSPMEFEAGLSSLDAAACNISPLKPAGIIFHMSRCGSTLVYKALRTAERVVGVSECQPIEFLMYMCRGRSEYWAAKASTALIAMTSLLGSYRGQVSSQLIIKTGANAMVHLPAIRALWPDVPCLIMIRNPIEVLVSNLQKPPRWFIDCCRDPSHSEIGNPPPELTDPTAESLAAWVAGRFCTEALSRMDSGCMVLDHQDINIPSLRIVASRFGLTFSADGDERLAAVLRMDAKVQNRQFESDGETKRRAASDVLTRSSERWADGPYAELMQSPQRIAQ